MSDPSDNPPPPAMDTAAYSAVSIVLECTIFVRIILFCATSCFHSVTDEFAACEIMSIAKYSSLFRRILLSPSSEHSMESMLIVLCFSCERGDFLKLFLHLDRPEVNEYTPWSGLLCGGFTDIPHVLYSSGPGLVLEFHTDRRASNASGFHGHFKFIDRREYKIFSGLKFNL